MNSFGVFLGFPDSFAFGLMVIGPIFLPFRDPLGILFVFLQALVLVLVAGGFALLKRNEDLRREQRFHSFS